MYLRTYRVITRRLGYRSFTLAAVLSGVVLRASSATLEVPKVSTPTIHLISYSGNTTFSSQQLQTKLTIKVGDNFIPDQIGFSVQRLASYYRDHGYSEVQVSSNVVAVEPLQRNVEFVFKEGSPYHVGQIFISGNKFISERIIRRELAIRPGDPFSQEKIYEGNKQLFLTGYFETIDIQYSTAPAHLMDIHMILKERSTRFIKGGGGYGTETKERVSIGYEDSNFFGNERRLDLAGSYSGFVTNPHKYRTGILNAGMTQPHLFGSAAYTGQSNLSQEWDDREAYNDTSTAWISSIGRRFGRLITADFRYRFQGTRLTRIDPGEASTITTADFTDVSAVGPGFTFDDTNDPFLPSHGWRIIGRAEQGLTWVVGDVRFKKFEAKVGRFQTVDGWTLFGGLQYGIIRPDDFNGSIPIFERFTLGGANTVRGYEEQELGPKDSRGSPLGGNEYAVGNLELRHRIYKKLFGVTFLDGGQLWQQPPGHHWAYIRAHGINDFVYGTGLGFRLQTPVGAVRLEFGYKLNPPGGNDVPFFNRTAIHFSLGEVF